MGRYSNSLLSWPPLFLVILLLAGCGDAPPYQAQLYVFGTLVDITIQGESPANARRAVRAISDDFQRMHREWHAWQPGPLTEVNDAIAAGRPASLIPSLIPIVQQSKSLYERSEGLFNPTIGRLLRLWGFQRDEPPNGPPPDREAIEKWVRLSPGMDDVEVKGDRLVSRNDAVQFDFGAFAKGYAIDRAIERLREFGIKNAIVNAGGDLRAVGRHGDRPWRVGIRHPQGEGVLAALEVEGDESVFTSGNYERFREHEGVHYMHILDPRTGWPVEGVTSVTVIHDNGAEADAAATALVVAGPKEWHRIARGLGLHYVMLVDDAGTVYMNPAMAERVQFTQKPKRIILSEPL